MRQYLLRHRLNHDALTLALFRRQQPVVLTRLPLHLEPISAADRTWTGFFAAREWLSSKEFLGELISVETATTAGSGMLNVSVSSSKFALNGEGICRQGDNFYDAVNCRNIEDFAYQQTNLLGIKVRTITTEESNQSLLSGRRQPVRSPFVAAVPAQTGHQSPQSVHPDRAIAHLLRPLALVGLYRQPGCHLRLCCLLL